MTKETPISVLSSHLVSALNYAYGFIGAEFEERWNAAHDALQELERIAKKKDD